MGFKCVPHPLFAEIVKINQIRNLISKPDCANKGDLQKNAYAVLRRVYNFSPAAWTELNEFVTEESKLIVDIYRSAVALYCMSSLQSIGALPPDPLLRDNCDMERQILHGLLEKLLRKRPHGYTFWSRCASSGWWSCFARFCSEKHDRPECLYWHVFPTRGRRHSRKILGFGTNGMG